ncbi:endonuclease Q family protein [soil metagenome]
MQYVTDFHLHSKYSRAVSPQMTLPVMDRLAQEKGIDILSAADFTHPAWFSEIRNLLEEKGEGVYVLKSSREKETLFILSTEIACIYKQGGQLRRIHNLVFAPSLAVAEKITKELLKRGCNLSADGRPIVGLSSKHLLQLILEIDERCMLIPAHVWTPHFGVYGSASGFDSLDECFEDLSPYIYGIETGLSSDPEMNWLIPELKNRSILSFSDAHSVPKMAREATVMDLLEPNYENIRRAIMRKGGKENQVTYTIEFYPEEGKYHFSGHRNCNVVLGPEEIRSRGNVCPVCGRIVTEGVLYRLQQLASGAKNVIEIKRNEDGLKWYTNTSGNHPPYIKLVPLLEIVAEAMGMTVNGQKVHTAYETLCKAFGDELTVILKTPIEKIAVQAGERVAEGVRKARSGEITIEPGYDGVYGKVKIWGEKKQDKPQLSLDL